MSSSPSPTASKGQSGIWQSLAPYLAPPLAGSIAIVPVFPDMIAKSAQQQGLSLPKITFTAGMKEGLMQAPVIGAIIGTQMLVESVAKKKLFGNSKDVLPTVVTSAIAGFVSSPLLALYNGSTMGWSFGESYSRFSLRQCMAITGQETCFVAGILIADPLGKVMKKRFGDNKAVDYAAAYISGAAGGLLGHPANTAVTRWPKGLRIESFRQSLWGSIRRTRAVANFSVIYKFGKETLNPNPSSK